MLPRIGGSGVKGLLIIGLVVGAMGALVGGLAELTARMVEDEILAHRLDELFGWPVRPQTYERYFGKPSRSSEGRLSR